MRSDVIFGLTGIIGTEVGDVSLWHVFPIEANIVIITKANTDLIFFQELQDRESIISKKENMLTERNELEMKKLRSSQTVAMVSSISMW